jgi:hypothetical protein
VIEPNDYEMCKHIADMLMEGATEDDLRSFGYLATDESRLCYAAAKERPEYWSNIALDTEAAGCMSYLPEEWLERNKDWYTPL